VHRSEVSSAVSLALHRLGDTTIEAVTSLALGHRCCVRRRSLAGGSGPSSWLFPRPPDSVKGGCGLYGEGPMNLPRFSRPAHASPGSVADARPATNSAQNPHTSSLRSDRCARPLSTPCSGGPGKWLAEPPAGIGVAFRTGPHDEERGTP